MVYIDITQNEQSITLNCRKASGNKESFQLIIDPVTKDVIKAPTNPDIDASAAYSCVYNLLKKGEPLPKHTVAAWG